MNIGYIVQNKKVFLNTLRYYFGWLKPKYTIEIISEKWNLVTIFQPYEPKSKFFKKRKLKYEKLTDQIIQQQQIKKVFYEQTDGKPSKEYFIKHFKQVLQKVTKMHKIPLVSADIALVCTDTNNQVLDSIIKEICILTRFAVMLTKDKEKAEIFAESIYDTYGYPLFVSNNNTNRDNFDIVLIFDEPDTDVWGKVIFNLTEKEVVSNKDSLVINNIKITSDDLEKLRNCGISEAAIFQICLWPVSILDKVRIIDFT